MDDIANQCNGLHDTKFNLINLCYHDKKQSCFFFFFEYLSFISIWHLSQITKLVIKFGQ